MSDIPLGAVTFVDSHRPALSAGDYKIVVSQALTSTVVPQADTSPIDETWSSTNCFAVQAPRFIVDPRQVTASFPPGNSQGDYSTALPHIAFGALALPWERAADLTEAGDPWLALLVFEATDPFTAATVHVGDLQREPYSLDPAQPSITTPSGLGATTASYCDGFAALGATFTLEHGQGWSDTCRVVDVPVDLFARRAPSAADLPWLVHVREVSGGTTPGSSSIVVANRLPVAGGTTVVHLVSLVEWSFACVDSSETFEGLLEGVSVDVLQLRVVGSPTGPGATVVNEAASLGYVALSHQTRVGDRTVSWYRGPCTPCQVGDGVVPMPNPLADPPTEPVSSADALVRYDPVTGLMDVSYAAAWQLGRLLALQDVRFSSALYAWKRNISERTALTVEFDVIAEFLGDELALGDGAASAHPPTSVARAGAAFLAARLPSSISTVGTERAANAEQGKLRRPLHSRSDVATRLRSVTNSAAQLTDVVGAAGGAPPDVVVSWLGQLGQLVGVPVGYLVPDTRQLPTESIRFFVVDPNWTRALVEGAFSIARATGPDVARDAVLASVTHAAAGTAPAAPTTSGFILRSAVVSGWPGLGVIPYDTDGIVLQVLRTVQLSSTVLLCLVSGVVDHVDVHEPFTGLHLGVGDAHGDVTARWIAVPTSAPANIRPGDPVSSARPVRATTRPGGAISIATLAAGLQNELNRVGASNDGNGNPLPFTSAELALQLTAAATAVRFVAAPDDGTTS